MHTLHFPIRASIALALAAASAPGLAQDAPPAAYEQQCRQLAQRQYPAADMSPPAAGGQCEPVGLYYGIGAARDYARARQCAFAAKDNDQPFQERHGVLMMLYANGLGVRRDYQLAQKAACDAGGAPAEIAERLAHLEKMAAAAPGSGRPIDVCDDITSGYMGGYCASIAAQLGEQTRGAAFAKLVASWTPQEKQALARLEQAAMRFADERSGSEVDRTGTLRDAFSIREEQRQLTDFRASIAAFERGALPRHSKADLARLDADMNAAYQQLRRMPEPSHSTFKFHGIQQTQRTWLAYRDAWVVFGKAKYPAVPAHAWQAHFTQKRTAMLKELVPLMEWGAPGVKPAAPANSAR